MNNNPEKRAEILCSVDPGASGGIAFLEPGTGVIAVKMPDTDAGKLELCRTICAPGRQPRAVRVYVEEVGGFVKPRRNPNARRCSTCGKSEESEGQPGSAMFTFGENAGLIRGMFLALGAEVELVRPQVWQAMLLQKKGSRTKPEWKNVLKGFAQRYFPGIKVTLNTADALCILRHAMNLANLPNVTVPGNVAPAKSSKGRDGARSELAAADIHPGDLFIGLLHGREKVFRKLPGGAMIVRSPQGEDFKLPRAKDVVR